MSYARQSFIKPFGIFHENIPIIDHIFCDQHHSSVRKVKFIHYKYKASTSSVCTINLTKWHLASNQVKIKNTLI